MAKKRTTKKKSSAYSMPAWVYDVKVWGIGALVVIVALLVPFFQKNDASFYLSERDTYY